jgi:hypothetical protein
MDGHCHIWDIRSKLPLYSLSMSSEPKKTKDHLDNIDSLCQKLFGIAALDQTRFCIGGEAGKLIVFQSA